MVAKKVFTGSIKALSHLDLKKFGRECIAIGKSLQKSVGRSNYKKVVDPIIRNGFKSNHPEIRGIAGKLLNGYKKFK